MVSVFFVTVMGLSSVVFANNGTQTMPVYVCSYTDNTGHLVQEQMPMYLCLWNKGSITQ
ncbi:TPA: hypothetical protein ACX6R8_000789 [Photobacterium damselae]|uniref:Uncharacterized protein n=1 Tax=Photobacterium damselae subsp. damselae TaxID=85581 RepID=A0A850QW74_PHODD|nr:hypothetical protein [Photobacterium damselae]MBF7099948.1 hypothetical protein [Photobacterium damselae]NVP02343.1 hypothetical protein [Photobacterium damselae subsp. damselae]